MKWSNKEEMVMDGNKIVGSNIMDLINDFSRSRKDEPVIGAHVLLKKLLEDNIPREAFVNKARLKLVDGTDEIYATPEIEPKIEPSHTHKRTPERIGKSKPWKSVKL